MGVKEVETHIPKRYLGVNFKLATPSKLLLAEIQEIAAEEGLGDKAMFFKLVREALAARRQARPTDSVVQHVDVALDRETYAELRQLAGDERRSIDNYVRRLIKSDIHSHQRESETAAYVAVADCSAAGPNTFAA